MNNFFVKCNMIRRSDISFNKSGNKITIPFIFHIKDLSNSFLDNTNENELEIYSSSIYFQNQLNKQKEWYKEILSYVDLSQFTLENGENNILDKYTMQYNNYRVFKNIDYLYDFLISIFNFNEIDFKQMYDFVFQNQYSLAMSYIKLIEEEMEIGSKKEVPTESFMILRCAYELNHSATVFPENMNKSISEFSFREIRTQRIYMSRKCELEQIQYDKIMKENKKGTGN